MEGSYNGGTHAKYSSSDLHDQTGTVASVVSHMVTIKFTHRGKDAVAMFTPGKMHINGLKPLLAVCKSEALLKEFLREGDTVNFDAELGLMQKDISSTSQQKGQASKWFITLLWKGTKPDDSVLKGRSNIRAAEAYVDRKVQILDVLAKEHHLLHEDIRACQCHQGEVIKILSDTHGVLQVKGKDILFCVRDFIIDGGRLHERDHALGHYVKIGDQLSCYTKMETVVHADYQFKGMAVSVWNDSKRNEGECWFLVSSCVNFAKLLPSPEAATRVNTVGIVREIHKAKGGIIDTGCGPEGLIYLHQSRVFVNGKKLRFCQTLEDILKVGDQVTCDIIKNETDGGATYVTTVAPWIALLVWKGNKPKIHPSLFKRLPAADIHRGRVVKLDLPGETGVESGMMIIESSMAPGRRVEFHRSLTYFFGLCLENADLSHLLREGDRVYCTIEQVPEMEESSVTHKATLAWIGYKSGPTIEDIFSETQLMSKYLAKLMFDLEMLDKLVAGDLPPKKHMPVPGMRIPDGAVFARVVGINPPTVNTGVATAVLLIESGIGAGHRASLHRNSLSIWGHSMAKADLSYIFNKDDELFCKIEPSTAVEGMKYKTIIAWVGSCTKDNVSCSKLPAWLKDHNLDADTFNKLVQGTMPPRMYLPFPGEIMVARVVTVDPPIDSTGVQSGILHIEKGSLEGSQARFHRRSFFVFGYQMDKADLTYLLEQKQKVLCEVEEVPLKEREQLKQETKYDAEYRTVLTWIGSCRPRNDGEDPSKKDQNFTGWLKKRGLTVQRFQKLVSGKLPPLSQDLGLFKNDTGSKTVSGKDGVPSGGPKPLMDMAVQPPPSEAYMNPLITHKEVAESLFESLKHINDPSDLLVDRIIENEEEAQIALFVSRTLTQALMSYRRRRGPPVPPALPYKRPYGPPDLNWVGEGYGSGSDFVPPFKRQAGGNSRGRGSSKGWGARF